MNEQQNNHVEFLRDLQSRIMTWKINNKDRMALYDSLEEAIFDFEKNNTEE